MDEGAGAAGAVPIPQEKRDDESGLGMRPGGIEVHVNGKRAGPPNGERGEQGPALVDIFARETERNQEAEKTVDGGGEGHGDAIGSGETVGGNCGAEGAGEKNAGVGKEKKRGPEDGGANGEVIIEMAGSRAEFGDWLAVFVETIFAEAFVGVLVIGGEIEIVLDQGGASVSVVADAVAAHPGIEHGEREQEEHQEEEFRFAGMRLRRRRQTSRLQ